MKTVETVLDETLGNNGVQGWLQGADNSHKDLRTAIIQAMREFALEHFDLYKKEYARKAIQEDRKNVAEHVTTVDSFTSNCHDHTPYRGACISCGRYDNPDILVGCSVDKNSIINAPLLKLE